MIKENKRALVLTSILILVPIIAGIALWGRLPDMIATHFGADNQPNGWMSKPAAVFLLPVIMLAIHWVAVISTAYDKRKSGVSPKMLTVLIWICPALSLVLSFVTYGYAMGLELNVGLICMVIIGVLFAAIGNYLPKCDRNSVVGVRVKWTYADENNWRATHRFAGWTMTLGGIAVLATAYLEIPWLFFAIIVAAVLAPVIYSYAYSRVHS